MAYNEKKQAYNEKYRKENLKQVMVYFQNDYYSNTLLPFIRDHGYSSTSNFIKQAVDHVITNNIMLDTDEHKTNK